MPGQVIGTIGDQEVRLDNAATESTLALLVAAVEKLSAKGGKTSKEAKLQELYNKRVQETTDLLEEENEKLDELNEQLEKSKRQWQEFGQDMSAIVGSIFSNTTVGLSNLASVFDNMGPLGLVAGALTRVVNQNVETFRELAAVGIDLGDSIFAAQTSAARAGLPLDIFAKTVSENATMLATLGGSATEGTRRFTEVSNSLRKNNFAQSLARLGFTMSDVAEHTADYMEQLTRLGRAQRMTDQDLAIGAQEYLLELDKLTRVTGQSRKEAESGMKKVLEDRRLRALMASMGEKERLALQSSIAGLQKAAPELAEGISELVATNGVPISEFGKALARNNPELLQNAKLLRAGAITSEEFNESIRRAAENSSTLSEEEEKLHAYLVARGKESPFADRVALMQMKNYAKEQANASKAQQDAMAMQGKAVAGFDESMTQIANFIKMTLLPIVQVFATGLSWITVGVSFVVDIFKELGSVIEGFVGEDIWGSIKSVVSGIVSTLTVLGVALLGFKKVLATKQAMEAVTGVGQKAVTSGALTNAAEVATKTAGGGAGKGLAGVGKGIAGFGKDIGKSISGVLGGLATGLTQLGSPKVLLGVVALAGIGATMWVTAKSLKEFTTVGWDSMAKGFVTLAGLGALGAILSAASIPIAIGAGVIALLGASLIPLAYAISVAAPNLEILSKELSTLTDLPIESMDNLGDALTSIGLGMASLGAGGVVSAISSFFGGDVSSQLADLGETSPGVVALADALERLDFAKLDASGIDLENMEIGAKRAQFLAQQLSNVRTQINSITAPSVSETIASAFESMSAKITTALAPASTTADVPNFKKTQESLLSDLGTKLDQLNIQVAELVDIQQQVAPEVRKTAKNTKWIG